MERKKRHRKRGVIVYILVIMVSLFMILLHNLSGKSDIRWDEPLFVEESVKQLANGDTYYTPNSNHEAIDMESCVIYYNNLIIVMTDHNFDENERNKIAELVNGEVVGVVNGAIHAFQIKVSESSLSQLRELAKEIMKQPNVLYAGGEYPVQFMSTITDNNPWAISNDWSDLGNEIEPDGNDWWAEAIEAYTAWNYRHLCKDIKVGIIDNGYETQHEDLIGKVHLINQNSAADHGTHVAGIIGAENNNVGIRGIVDFAQLYCADLWEDDSIESRHTLLEYFTMMNNMIQNGTKVINNSWGALWPEDRLSEAFVENRLNKGLRPTAEISIVMMAQLITSGYENFIVVQAAGNGDDTYTGVDARYSGFFCMIDEGIYNHLPETTLSKLYESNINYEMIEDRIIIVGAVENLRDDKGNYYMTEFSNYGTTVDICAPGKDIYSTVTEESEFYTAMEGTSMAAPMVTGSVAYVWALNPELTAGEVREILLDGAIVKAISLEDGDNIVYPMLNLGNAVKKLCQ